ncbi:MAG: UDP binding domain-containing protein, partial [Sutterellaceae bacterium]|nr:hypothetical protein [Burkholderiaceae bacterium]MDW8429351.1 UDP binding domain-containing protein [Sutterellaceae bacterium]
GVDVADVMRGVHLARYFTTRLPDGGRVAAGITSFLWAGCGYGGSCLPKDTQALAAHGAAHGAPMPLLEAVIETNRRQPARMIALLERHFARLAGLRVSVLGVAFKEDTDDVRESPALPIVRALLQRGARVTAYDPVARANGQRALPTAVTWSENLEQALAADAVPLITRWREFERLPALLAGGADAPLVVDGRRMLAPASVPRYAGIGRRGTSAHVTEAMRLAAIKFEFGFESRKRRTPAAGLTPFPCLEFASQLSGHGLRPQWQLLQPGPVRVCQSEHPDGTYGVLAKVSKAGLGKAPLALDHAEGKRAPGGSARGVSVKLPPLPQGPAGRHAAFSPVAKASLLVLLLRLSPVGAITQDLTPSSVQQSGQVIAVGFMDWPRDGAVHKALGVWAKVQLHTERPFLTLVGRARLRPVAADSLWIAFLFPLLGRAGRNADRHIDQGARLPERCAPVGKQCPRKVILRKRAPKAQNAHLIGHAVLGTLASPNAAHPPNTLAYTLGRSHTAVEPSLHHIAAKPPLRRHGRKPACRSRVALLARLHTFCLGHQRSCLGHSRVDRDRQAPVARCATLRETDRRGSFHRLPPLLPVNRSNAVSFGTRFTVPCV